MSTGKWICIYPPPSKTSLTPPLLLIHSYLCDDYVLSDNSSGDIALVQALLIQVASQQYESCSRSGRVIRPAQAIFSRSKSRVEEASDHAADKRYTALCHWR